MGLRALGRDWANALGPLGGCSAAIPNGGSFRVDVISIEAPHPFKQHPMGVLDMFCLGAFETAPCEVLNTLCPEAALIEK